ncbi:hypothetical protein F5Y03DRAFT_349042 [Xylaria venustula]|nr:hypothetical protein F5Y03DRAFT_349042 [Xylaria venustula]
MERLCQVLIALALVVPALAAPGPVHTIHHPRPHPPSHVTKDPSYTEFVTFTSSKSIPMTTASSVVAPVISPPTELRKRDDDDDDDKCTPGDRKCHASLEEVLFCNDNHEWVSYAQCSDDTICHRLEMICVSLPSTEPVAYATASPTLSLQDKPADSNGDDDYAYGHLETRGGCKEGDRRCSEQFNRVDRCNSNQEWVSYHDCRKSELCDQIILECLPSEDPSGVGQLCGIGAPSITSSSIKTHSV